MSWFWSPKLGKAKQYPSPYGQYDANASSKQGSKLKNVVPDTPEEESATPDAANKAASEITDPQDNISGTDTRKAGWMAAFRPSWEGLPTSPRPESKRMFAILKHKPMETQLEDPAKDGTPSRTDSQIPKDLSSVDGWLGPQRSEGTSNPSIREPSSTPVTEPKASPFFKPEHANETPATEFKRRVSQGFRGVFHPGSPTSPNPPQHLSSSPPKRPSGVDRPPTPLSLLSESSFVDSRPALPPAPPPSTVSKAPTSTAQSLGSDQDEALTSTARTRARLFLHRTLPGLVPARRWGQRDKAIHEEEVETGPWVRKEEGTVVDNEEDRR